MPRAAAAPRVVVRQPNHRNTELIMADHPTIRAWKDEEYCLTLDPGARAALPPSPAGTIELADDDLGDVAGGDVEQITQTSICGTGLACLTVISIAISKNISCGACDTTLWSGTCWASSIGCCPPT
jgi:mersacidin/lichenicidin family type 2 lantibiotic